jgi:hypothetical protein
MGERRRQAGQAASGGMGRRARLDPTRSGRGGAGRGWGGAGTLPRVGEGQVREDLPDDGGIVEDGDQAQPTPTIGTRQDVNRERPVHEGRPGPGARRGCHPGAVRTWGQRRRRGRGLGRHPTVRESVGNISTLWSPVAPSVGPVNVT